MSNMYPVVVRSDVIVPFDISKIGLEHDALTPVARELIQFALNQLGQNSAAGAKKACGVGASEGAIATKAGELWRKRADTLYAGEWSTRGAGGSAKSDPVENVARAMCTKAVAAKLGVKGKPNDAQAKKILAGVDKNWEKFRAQAEKIVAERAAAKEVAIDL